MKNVLVLLPIEERHKARLDAAGEGCRFTYSTRAAATKEQPSEMTTFAFMLSPP